MISFAGEARDFDVRDYCEITTRAYLRQHGIEPGRRWGNSDPQITYQSDLIEDEVGNIHLNPAGQEKLADILQDAMPAGLAKLIARAAHTLPGYWADTPEATQWREDIEYIVRSHLEREAGL